MTLLYGFCAVAGGSLLVVQFLLAVLGLHGHHGAPGDVDGGGGFGHGDVHHGPADHDPHDATWYFGVISYRTMVAALTFFGLTGLAAVSARMAAVHALILALAAGAEAMFAVPAALRPLARLRSDGTVRLEQAVGRIGTVYLKVPRQRTGAGKVQLCLQGRTVELEALTDGEEIPTCARVVVRELSGSESIVVAPAFAPHEVSHA